MSIQVRYTQGNKDSVCPIGRSSFEPTRFAEQFETWSPDWDKPVIVSHGTKLKHDELEIGKQAYRDGKPDFKNGDTVLLFEEAQHYIALEADFFTRLLFTEAQWLNRRVKLGALEEMSIADALRTRRSPGDAFWVEAGLPGVPLAIGVNASIRADNDTWELLAHKQGKAQGGMGDTVGPPVSGGITLDIEMPPEGRSLTLDTFVKACMQSVAERELEGKALVPPLVRRAAWLDKARGYKPEINFLSMVPAVKHGRYEQVICKEHAGCITLDGHLDKQSCLVDEAYAEFKSLAFNAQAWCLWSK
ncbi:hypothetical protein [Trinickia fusca]|uniref:Uncharacterized protein n=1 Tax=Trinickia fusca TaxID=2419777 RepID=A0A494X6R8_9BURK|nr:hypothetical protein [Trinickia fusca]RKP45992.1 hypothetical protein D7S89_18625 [Trinickia fusca]